MKSGMLHLLMVMGLVILGGVVPEGAGTRVHDHECKVYPVVKTFNLKDPVTNDPCTLEIMTTICGGFCESNTRMGSKVLKKTDPATGAYRLSTVTECECCESVLPPRLLSVRPMTYPCAEGHKWNQTLYIPSLTTACHCRSCTSSNTVG